MGNRVACIIAIAIASGCGPDDRAPSDSSTDVGGGDDATHTGQFGDPCTQHVDCMTGYCVEPAGGAGGVCSRECNNDCPGGYDCLPVMFPDGAINLCVPSTARVCQACASDAECPGGACLTIDGSSHCGSTCTDSTQCPIGYTCGADPAGTHAGKFCQPTTASCTCNAAMAGAMRTCANMNPIGTCFGTQACDAVAGWSACSARIPAVEVCDGIDNNCNFVIDDGVGGGESCTNTVNGVGSCPGVRTCEGASGFQCHGQIPTPEACNSIDDDCDGSIDEGYPGLGTVCSAGVGACVHYGSIRCNTGGTGTECSAVAGTPTAELCNGIDDDCDSSIDETFPTLGQPCSTGLGVCTRYGTYVCDAMATGTTCTAMPGSPTGAETCNYLDDDCDGVVDNGFRDTVSGYYTGNTNCGACGNDCTTVFTGPNSYGACVVAGTPHCEMQCNPGTDDLDASTVDGCEFVLDATAIYVSGDDASAVDDFTCGLGPTGTGGGFHPCNTITYGVLRAGLTARVRVNVADATYIEPVSVSNGISLYGGYRADTWQRHLATTSTVIEGVASSGAHDHTVAAVSITNATTVEGFVIRGSFNTKPGGNSYAVYISGSNANLTLRANQIVAGRGGPGAAGTPGQNGAAGTNGANYTSPAYDSFQVTGSPTCDPANNRAGYGGAVQLCQGADNVGGGNGGGNNCTPLRSTQNSTATSQAAAGQPGAGAGGGTGGASGVRGWDGDQQNNICFIPVTGGNQPLPMYGTAGGTGGSAANAGGVVGCTAAAGSVSSGDWIGGSAPSGVIGANGGGGGGGGAGGGGTCTNCSFGNKMNAMFGGHGGGGAAGGCGGTGGGAGASGGGVFGVFVVGGTAPTLTSNTITGGTAGDGGTGGIAGAGGLGGTGSQGGQIGVYFCSGKGGRGGDGGNGGAGGGGGGGCGGSSFGIFTSGVGTPAYCGSNTVTVGTGGGLGAGGFSAGTSGGNGTAGLATACTSI